MPVATNAYEVNLLCCMTAHGINSGLHTIARIRNPEYADQIATMPEVFPLSLTVNPEKQAALEIERIRNIFKDEELRLYVGIAVVTVILIVWNIRDLYGSLGETIRHAAFQVSSIMTTTGFATTDFDLWPAFSKGLLMMLMVIGACAGSTGGGLKCSRVLLSRGSWHKR